MTIEKQIQNMILVQRAILAILLKHSLIKKESAEMFMAMISPKEGKEQ